MFPYQIVCSLLALLFTVLAIKRHIQVRIPKVLPESEQWGFQLDLKSKQFIASKVSIHSDCTTKQLGNPISRYHFKEPKIRKERVKKLPRMEKQYAPTDEKKYLTKVPPKSLTDEELMGYFRKDIDTVMKIAKDYANFRSSTANEYYVRAKKLEEEFNSDVILSDLVSKMRKLQQDGLL